MPRAGDLLPLTAPMFIDAEYATILARIEPERPLLDLEIIPGQFPPIPHSPYRPGYDWLFTVERMVARTLEPWLKPFRFELIGDTGVLCEVLANAFCHGHGKRPDLPIAISATLGKKGILLSVSDQGPGFDVDDVLHCAASGRPYYLIAGNGMQRLAHSANFHVFFDHKGSRCNFLHFFSSDDWPDLASCPSVA